MGRPLIIVADANMPEVESIFAGLGQLRLLPGRQITRGDLRDVDILLVRSVTRVDQALIANTPIRFVGSATAGLDHIDLAALAANKAHFVNAAGANARSVCEYVLAVLSNLRRRKLVDTAKRIGVVGAGNVGREVASTLIALGYSVLCYDPFIKLSGIAQTNDLMTLTTCGIICVHTPLTTDGLWPTQTMLGKQFLKALAPQTVVIAAGRGGVVDEAALKPLLATQELIYVADVWQGEPCVDRDLVPLTVLATPHIAGYSYDSKIKATRMLYSACCEFFGIEPSVSELDDTVIELYADPSLIGVEQFDQLVVSAFDIAADDSAMRDAGLDAAGFDALRAHYRNRREFDRFAVRGLTVEAAALASTAGFKVQD